MKKLLKDTEVAGLIVIVILFLVSAYLAKTYDSYLLNSIEIYPLSGPFIYIFITIIATVIAPISATPLIPVATVIWGPFLAALLSIIGWNIGSIIAFLVARKYGKSFIQKSKRLKVIQGYINAIPSNKFFWTIVLLRTAIPVDLLSYALGLFSNIALSTYILTTLLGITPFAFLFAYTATIPITYQIFILLTVGLFLFYEYNQFEKNINKKINKS